MSTSIYAVGPLYSLYSAPEGKIGVNGFLLSAGTIKNANVNGSVTPVEFSYSPAAGTTVVITKLIVTIADIGTFPSAVYGSATVITTGIRMLCTQNGVLVNLAQDIAIKSNLDMASISYQNQNITYAAGDTVRQVEFNYIDSGSPIVLNGDTSDKFYIVIQDDLTGLKTHYFRFEGFQKK